MKYKKSRNVEDLVRKQQTAAATRGTGIKTYTNRVTGETKHFYETKVGDNTAWVNDQGVTLNDQWSSRTAEQKAAAMSSWKDDFVQRADAVLKQQGIEPEDLGLTTEEYASQIASWGLANNYDVGDTETLTHLDQIASRALRQKIKDRNNDKKRDTHLDVYMDYEQLKSVTGPTKANVWTINPEAKPEDQRTVHGAVVNDIMGCLLYTSPSPRDS